MSKKLFCGAAKIEITPAASMLHDLPAFPGTKFSGILDPLYLRAIALGDGENKALLVSFDLGGAPSPKKYITELSERTGIPFDNILFVGTHTHSTPFIEMPGGVPNPSTKLFGQQVHDALLKAVDEAIANMRPAKAGCAKGNSYINVNRNQDYISYDKDGNRVVTSMLGWNPEGPSDKTLFVLRLEDYDGKAIAFFVNYAVHCVVMHMNKCINGGLALSSDLGGNISRLVERKFDDSVAIWTSGAAGDQNPIYMNSHYTADISTGEFTCSFTDDSQMLHTLAARQFADILHTLENIEKVSDVGDISCASALSQTPGRDVVPVDPSNLRGEYKISTGKNTKPYEVRVHLMKLGEVVLVGISGELYTTLGQHIKAVSPCRNTVVVTHDAAHMIGSGYIHDDDAIEAEAFASQRSRILPGYVKESLGNVTLELFKQLS